MNYYLVHTTYLVVFLSVFARQLSLPVPAILFLLSGGALAGADRLSFPGLLAVSVLGCVLGDLAWFEAGRLRGKRVLRLLCALASDPSLCIRRSRTTFAARGLPLLLVAKFIPGLDGITPPLAGIAGTPRSRFILFDAGGSALWSMAYLGAGFLFAASLDRAAHLISVVANVLVVVFGIPLVAFFLWKALRMVRMFRLLQPLTITPLELRRRLDSGARTGVLDLLRFEDDPENIPGIPGAVRVRPSEMRRRRSIGIPDDVILVLYCNRKNRFVSTRVAAQMWKRKVRNIRVLHGGLQAWQDAGYPVTCDLADPVAEMQRLGVILVPPLEATSVDTSEEQRSASRK
ncbi:VTT domain-containing protein [Silvibacterium sp.]|uniref:VTT domain-containing protein n=1 Tax=Silvibacterium sp. TaxID=1964179 RepID=UPI0039E38D9D